MGATRAPPPLPPHHERLRGGVAGECRDGGRLEGWDRWAYASAPPSVTPLPPVAFAWVVQPTLAGVAVVSDPVGTPDQQNLSWAVPRTLMPGSYRWHVNSTAQGGAVTLSDTGRAFSVAAVDLAWGVTAWSPCNVTCGEVRPRGCCLLATSQLAPGSCACHLLARCLCRMNPFPHRSRGSIDRRASRWWWCVYCGIGCLPLRASKPAASRVSI
jgi:hypothetical protein